LENDVDVLRDVIDMAYHKVVETIPLEKREELSDKLIDAILVSKNEDKMPAGLANTILYHWQRGLLAGDVGLAAVLEAAVLLEPDRTMEILEGELQLVDAVKAVKGVLMKAEK
jgi:hypothetical protein